jgi:ribosomal protein L10
MSKQVKDLITKELSSRWKDLDGVAVINPRGINATKNNLIRRRLHAKGLRMMVVKNTLARRATEGTSLKGFDKLLDGPSAVIYGDAQPADDRPRRARREEGDDTIELRGVFFDGEVYVGDKGVEQVSKLPTREEAIGQLVAAILGPGRKLAAALKGPAACSAAILKTIGEQVEGQGRRARRCRRRNVTVPRAEARGVKSEHPTVRLPVTG